MFTLSSKIAVVDLLLEMAAHQPVRFVIEGLHWAFGCQNTSRRIVVTSGGLLLCQRCADGEGGRRFSYDAAEKLRGPERTLLHNAPIRCGIGDSTRLPLLTS